MLPLDAQDLLFRVRGGLYLDGAINKEGEIKASLSEAIKNLINKVNSQTFVLFGVDSSLYMWPKSRSSTEPGAMNETATCKTILKFVPLEVNDYLRKLPKKKSVKVEPLKVINLELLFELTRPELVESVTVQYNTKSSTFFKLTLPVDVVIFVNPDDPWEKLLNLVVEAVSVQLSEMDSCIQRYGKKNSIPIPQAFHFELPEKTTLTTVVYPAGITDDELEPQRKELHTKLSLGDKPFLRRPMAYHFPADEIANTYLRNIHKYIPLPDAEEFGVHVVHGSYTYHHYLQDDINDTGWGCAYRSLQTIISWFNFQGYINVPIPSHEEIQKMLVSAGDTAPDIVGSADWIGSFEIRTVLNTLGVTSKVLSFSTGSEIVMSARELSEHFIVQGTPIMVGGEPLAHTVLGVAWNESTGASKFLVLDAHYAGEDDWSSAIERGVEWKSADFWDQSEPYNICLPQRPEGI
uniref:ufm1-specific protease 2-like n=1 Tax=Pristiophorus japonicus TaxID=55135 RepID=UPI00398EF5F6